MDERTQEALILRLNWTLGYMQEGKSDSAENEIRELIKEIKQGIVVPF